MIAECPDWKINEFYNQFLDKAALDVPICVYARRYITSPTEYLKDLKMKLEPPRCSHCGS